MAYVNTSDDSMTRYKRLEKLGEGTYGLVYKARDLETNEIVAIKKIKLDNNEEGIPATTMREISLLSHLKHPNIVNMDGCIYACGELYLIFEYMSCDLKGYVDSLPRSEYLTPKLLKKFSYFLTEGVRFCHSRRILHRDLKPQNILVSDDLQLKIADFGLGREHGLPIGELTHEVVTLWYRPPEILLGKKKYSGACDVWGIGCIIAEMATKVPLFPGDSEIDQLFQIYRVMGTPNNKTWPGIVDLPEYKAIGPKWKKKDMAKELQNKMDKDGVDLMERMLTFAPNKRITAKKMLCHPWFDEVREEMIKMFGNVYPHCGNKEYQLKAWQRKHNIVEVNENANPNKMKMNKQKKKGGKNKNKSNKMDNDDDESGNEENAEEEEDSDYDEDDDFVEKNKGKSKKYNDDSDNDIDDDDDVTANAEEWHKNQQQNLNNSNLSQPMDEDK